MAELLEINGSDIALLNDSDLRTLIGLLCEADFKRVGLSTKDINWGGHQNAKDGGIDVAVNTKSALPRSSFIPCKNTYFQVKKSDMSASKISDEMKPKGVLREKIRQIVGDNGAYIIISAQSSTSQSALTTRINAMRKCVKALPNSENATLDFFDQGRIATWVREHPSLILWVRNKIGRPLKGWKPFDNWSHAPKGINEEYLFDDSLRVIDTTKNSNATLSAMGAMDSIKDILSSPRKVVRLAGLSGVGKTRFVQALFDQRIGSKSLNDKIVYYTDMSDSPNPDPTEMVGQLISLATRAIIIVDNCPPELHRGLKDLCTSNSSIISLLTVEYDVREDYPDETSVFLIEPASDLLIQKMIKGRYTHVNQVDAQTIANFSGGNARIAIALANTLKKGETLSGFHEEELFNRLFKQRNPDDKDLLMSAEVLSLLYSFEGTDTSSPTSEMAVLASLIGVSANTLYRNVAELIDRDLIQSRDVWRAVLPHAIANKLAQRALERISPNLLLPTVLKSSERLIRSFTRRLTYLHLSPVAAKIVNEWLEEGGWLSDLSNLNSLQMDAFENIASVCPIKALETIERSVKNDEQFFTRDNSHKKRLIAILRHLSFEEEYFTRSTKIMALFILEGDSNAEYGRYGGNEKERANATLKSLFFIYLPGTKAKIEQRLSIVEWLIARNSEKSYDLAIDLLEAMLEAWHFNSPYNFQFGARPRGSGYRPSSKSEISEWFAKAFKAAVIIALSNELGSEKMKLLLAQQLGALWTQAGIIDEIEAGCLEIKGNSLWVEGWIALSRISSHDSKNISKTNLRRLHRLIEKMRPQGLNEEIKAYALGINNSIGILDTVGDDIEAGLKKIEEKVIDLGKSLANDELTFKKLLPDLLSNAGMYVANLGQGLYLGTEDKEKIWSSIKLQFSLTPDNKKEVSLMMGFLGTAYRTDKDFFNKVLDKVLIDKDLQRFFPRLQSSGFLDLDALRRAHYTLDNNLAKVSEFLWWAWTRNHDTLSDDALGKLIEKIYSKENSTQTALEMLFMRFQRAPKDFSKSIINTAQLVLSEIDFKTIDQQNDQLNLKYKIARIAEVCFLENGQKEALSFIKNIVEAIKDGAIYAHNYIEIFSVVANRHPIVLLEGILGGETTDEWQRNAIFRANDDRNENPLNMIDDQTLINWGKENPDLRFPIIAAAARMYRKSNTKVGYEWRPIFFELTKSAPNVEKVLFAIQGGIRPNGWSGSLSDILQKRISLFDELLANNNPQIVSWAKSMRATLMEWISREKQYEHDRTKAKNESFE